MLKKIVLQAILLALLSFSGAIWLGVVWFWQNGDRIDRIMDNLETSTASIAAASDEASHTLAAVGRSVALYEEQLGSTRSQKAVQASLEAAASWKATAMLVNTTVVPRVNEVLDQMTRAVASTDGAAQEATMTIARAKKSFEEIDGVVREATGTLAQLTKSQQSLTLDAQATMGEMKGLLQTSTLAMMNVEKATRSAPGIARSLDKIAASGSKWQKPLNVATLVLAVIGALK